MFMFSVVISFITFSATVAQASLGGVLCRLPKDSGYQCGMSVMQPAYYFDVTVGECIEFMFNGCGGNQNRFATKNECVEGCSALAKCGKGLPMMDFAGNIKRCDGDRIPCPGGYDCIGRGMESVCCRKADRICSMSVDSGKYCGTVSETRYFFDGGANLCRPFAYRGCSGNENNFKSKGECLKFCAQQIYCLKGDPWPDRFAVSRIASCHTSKDCPENYSCIQRNNRKACCPSKTFVCGTPFDKKAVCRRMAGTKTGWTFNSKKGHCEKVDASMCSEQLNNFASLEQCVDYCIGGCPDGSEPHMNPFTEQPQMCNFNTNSGCPLGFTCLKRSMYAAVCCKSAPLCPATESLMQLNVGLGNPVRCTAEDASNCLEGYTCQQAKNHEHICCTLPLECPYGMKTIREDNNRPHLCTPGIAGNCPVEGTFCIRADLGHMVPQKHLCCQPERRCIIPFVNVKTRRPQKCFPGDRRCPPGTHCLEVAEEHKPANTSTTIFYCCHDVDVFTCPQGDSPITDSVTKKPKACIPSNPNACPIDYSCENLMDGSNACCPLPTKRRLCRAPIINHDGNPLACFGQDDVKSCSNVSGVCKRTLDMNYHCCKQ